MGMNKSPSLLPQSSDYGPGEREYRGVGRFQSEPFLLETHGSVASSCPRRWRPPSSCAAPGAGLSPGAPSVAAPCLLASGHQHTKVQRAILSVLVVQECMSVPLKKKSTLKRQVGSGYHFVIPRFCPKVQGHCAVGEGRNKGCSVVP